MIDVLRELLVDLRVVYFYFTHFSIFIPNEL